MKCLTFATTILIVISAKAGNARKHWADSSSNVTLRVVGGHEVIPNSLPFQAYLEISDRDGRTLTCGGSLITRTAVLTGANCIYVAKSVEVILGAHNRGMFEPCQQRQTVPETNFRLHPGYTPSTPDDDIALLILEKRVRINKCVQTADLPTASDKFVGEPGVISGWGMTTDDIHSSSSVLMSVTLPILSNEDCGKYLGAPIPDRRMCADGYGGKGSCYGDGGGPLTVRRNDRWVVVGISAFIALECEKGHPSGFTRVSSFLDWIDQNAKK
jgi:secreted trypsin-like serine protease